MQRVVVPSSHEINPNLLSISMIIQLFKINFDILFSKQKLSFTIYLGKYTIIDIKDA